MSFQINEKMMAQNRAIITRNNKESDLTVSDALKFKPGMLHFIADNEKMFLSIAPRKEANGNTKKFLEIITDKKMSDVLENYVHRDGGASSSLRGQLHSIVPRGTAPFKITSNTQVDNLNADMVDGYHASLARAGGTLVVRDGEGTVLLGEKVWLGNNMIVSNDYESFSFVEQGTREPVKIIAKDIDLKDGVISTPTSKIEWKNNVWHAGPTGSTSEIVTKALYGSGKGINADMVDGMHVDDSKNTNTNLWTAKKIEDSRAPRGYGLGTDVNVITNNNCNDAAGTGVFSGTAPTNGVSGETGEAILQNLITNNSKYQTIVYTNTSNSYSRTYLNGIWTSWTKNINKDNFGIDAINVIVSSTAPNVTNENTFWFETI